MWDVNCEEGRICTRQDALARGGIEAAHAVATGATLLCGAQPDDESQQKQRRGSHRHRQTLAAWAAVRASGRARAKIVLHGVRVGESDDGEEIDHGFPDAFSWSLFDSKLLQYNSTRLATRNPGAARAQTARN